LIKRRGVRDFAASKQRTLDVLQPSDAGSKFDLPTLAG